MKKIVAAIAAAAAVLAVALHAQQVRDQAPAPKTGSAVLSGSVMSEEQTPQPLRRAAVTAASPEAGFVRTTYTNDAGKFSFTGLPAGRYSLSASKAPYLRMNYGAKRPEGTGTSITLSNNTQMTDISMRLPRGAVIAGRIADENGEPASGVSVGVVQARMVNGERTFQPPAFGFSNDMTDDRGMFRMYGLPPGEYMVVATPRTTSGELRAMTDDEIRAVMQALKEQQTARAAQQNMQNPAGGYGAMTPTPTPTPTPKPDTEKVTVAYAPVYYPGTTVAATAGTVTVGAGEDRSGIDFAMRLVRTAKVEGQVLAPAGIAPQNVQLTMLPAAQPGGATSMMVALERMGMQGVRPGPDGKFSYVGVAPGTYIISARASRSNPGAPPPPPPPPGAPVGVTMTRTMTVGGDMTEFVVPPGFNINGDPNAMQYWAQVEVPVDGAPVSGITLSLQPGMTVTGKIEFRSIMTRPGADYKSVQLNLSQAAGGGGRGVQIGAPGVRVDESGQFTITGVVPGKYRLAGSVPMGGNQGPPTGPPWRLGSAVVKGRDILDFPLEVQPGEDINGVVVTFTDGTQEISGALLDQSGRPAPDYTILVFPSDKALWSATRRIRTARPATDGKFVLQNLPPGEYLMAAVTDLLPSEQNDPAFLEQVVPAAFKITLAPGEKKAQDLKISGGL